ncbi:MAG: ABC transporter ATP-binding protein [Planctomycetota bacterium]|nr:ABC transporter ATP-binding protein [Planctomycetota bacterium]
MPDTPILELDNVVKQYVAPDGTAVAAVLRGITLAITPGEALAVVGPSGSGKSTLLNIMGTLDRPTSGRMLLEVRDLADANDEALAAVRNRRIGFVFQLHHLLPQCTALENVLVPTLAPGATRSAADAEADARKLLARVGLADRLSYRPGQLSGGERQRVAVARALINKPAILLADEPTGSLDRASAEELALTLAELNRADGMTLVVVTHSASLAAQMGRRLELCDGRLAPVA